MTTVNSLLEESQQTEFGQGRSVQVASGASAKIVVASYNIRYAVGQFLISGGLLRKAGLAGSRGRPAQVQRNIQSAAQFLSNGQIMPRADVVALQEADRETARAGGHHVARELADELRMTWTHAPAGIPRGVKPKPRQWWLDFEEPIALFDEGDTGVALLSKLPLQDVIRIDLPWHECAWRPRLAIAATVPLADTTLRIVNAHVDPHAAVNGQLEQLEVLVAEAKRFEGPTLILGDFNTLSKKKVAETRSFLESHGYATPFPSGTATWRGAGIRLHADWIFYRDVTVTRWGVGRPLNVSDHWPIWAEVEA